MSTPLLCTLLVDGHPYADTADDYTSATPTALSGMALTWGRDTTLDQPSASSVAVKVARRGDGPLPDLKTGQAVRVTATGTTYPDPSVSTFTDPGFTTGQAATVPTNATAAVVSGALRMLATRPAEPAAVAVAPAAFSTAPDAWDAIPSTRVGQRWSASVRVLAPVGARVELAPVAFGDPTGTDLQAGEGFVITANGSWQTINVPDIYPSLDGAWVGVQVTTDRLPSWAVTSGTWAAAAGTWADRAATLIDDVQVLAPTGGTPRTALLFAGRITDLDASWDTSLPRGGGVQTSVTAVDFTADLDNNIVADTPWPVQRLDTRVNRILQLAGSTVAAVIAPSIAATQVTYRDVDAQPAAGLVVELAASVDAIAWSAVHQTTGPYYRIEDPAARPTLLVLEKDTSSGKVKIVAAIRPGRSTTITAHHVPRNGVHLVQGVSDVSSVVDVTWLEQITGTPPTTTEHHYVVTDAALLTQVGVRRVSLRTQLQSSTDAAAVAARLAARVAFAGWRIQGLSWDTSLVSRWDTATTTAALDLLDGTTRIGRPLALTDLPAWVPQGPTLPVYLEGATYTYDDGRWLLDLTVSRAGDTGHSAAWSELDATWRWTDMDPTITWGNLYGVGGPISTEVTA